MLFNALFDMDAFANINELIELVVEFINARFVRQLFDALQAEVRMHRFGIEYILNKRLELVFICFYKNSEELGCCFCIAVSAVPGSIGNAKICTDFT